MTGSRTYPDESAGSFPNPPATVEDTDGRPIELTVLEPTDEEGFDDLVAMYGEFDPSDRAQGIPPTGEGRIRDWLEPLVADGVNLLARHDGAVVGHATLVPETDDVAALDDLGDVEWELAIFVHQPHQQMGIGTALLEHLLGEARRRGIERVWLTVERWNAPAISLYERVGFERCGGESFEQEMSIRL